MDEPTAAQKQIEKATPEGTRVFSRPEDARRFQQRVRAWLNDGLPGSSPALTAAAAPLEDPMTEPTPEGTVTHAGLAVQAADTGRVLMIQRSLDQDDAPDVLGTWEFPGGSIEDGDEGPQAAAMREFTEETGLPVPPGEVTGGWASPDGVYQGFVWTTPVEADAFAELNPDLAAAEAINPDDPERRNPDVSAWWTIDGVQGAGPVIRPEVLASTDWTQFMPPVDPVQVAQTVTENEPDEQEPAMTASAAPDPTGALVMRLQGHTYADIMAAHGYATPASARQAVQQALTAAATQVGTAENYLRVDDDGNTVAEVVAAAPALDTTDPQDAEVPEGTPALAQDIAEDGLPFYGIIAPEGVPSDDGRMFSLDAMLTRDLPLPLMCQDAQLSGHDGAVRVGRIDEVWRDDTTYATPMIRYRGVWDDLDANEYAATAYRQVDAGVARGTSVDGVDVTSRLVDSQGNDLDPMDDMAPADGVVIEVADAVKMAGLTICSVPAFSQTYIANGRYEDRTEPEPGQAPPEPLPTGGPEGPADAPETPAEPVEDQEPPAVAASAATAPAWSLVASAGDDTWVLPAAHFTDPQLEGPTALTVDPDGRVYGHLALWGSCHIGQAAGQRGTQAREAGKCMEVPTSASGYAYFNTGTVYTDDGGQVNVGQLTMGTGHASLRASAYDTLAHYDNTGTAIADVRVGQDTHGIWFSGHIRPDAAPAQVHALTASGSVSGDWREVVRGSRQLELVAALVVNVPGYPIGRPQVTRAAGGPTALVASGAITPEKPAMSVGSATITVDDAAVADFAARVMAHIQRTERITAARARARAQRATRAAARLNGRTS